MMRFIFFILFVFLSLNLFSQNQNNIWYFGQYAGIDFNTNPPIALTNSNMNTIEGCATICNAAGNLLFYTNGVSVWNKNHSLMPNGFGLFGHESSTQSALIIPKPGDCNIYYIFTTPDHFEDSAFCYSIVDVNLDGGLGDVASKNIPLQYSVCEKLTGIIKSNGVDYWVIVKDKSNAFMAYSVTNAGVNGIPVTSYSGIPVSTYDEPGYIRLSPDGTKLSMAYQQHGICQLFDFNSVNGIVSNPIELLGIGVNDRPYGVEFSPDNSRLYLSFVSTSNILQYNLLAGSSTAIQNSGLPIPTINTGSSLKLGPNGMIYISKYNFHSIAVIEQPNNLGLSCNYNNYFLDLGTGYSKWGLPNNINTYLPCSSCAASVNITSYATICSGQTYQLPSGVAVSIEGFYMDTIRGTNFCDSIITTVNLQVNSNSMTSQTDSIYLGQQYVLPSGQTVSIPGSYQSTLINSNGCDSIITTILTLRKSTFECLLNGNSFTPNGDGINDLWKLYSYNCFKKMEVSVYNRYGNQVYYSYNYINDWDGKYKGKQLPDGTYYYVVKVTSVNGHDYMFKNNVTILR